MLTDLVRLQSSDVSVSITKKGFGTRVMITAATGSGLGPAELEELLDELARPQRRPYSK